MNDGCYLWKVSLAVLGYLFKFILSFKFQDFEKGAYACFENLGKNYWGTHMGELALFMN